MCCFSRQVISVSSTNIFARAADHDRQLLVYGMTISAKDDLAMILPLPIRTPAGERDVEFIDLKGYPGFFTDLERGFPSGGGGGGGPVAASASAATRTDKLAVVAVGNFEASFVPTLKDFFRLDERFRLPPNTWEKLPDYKTYGFAVFKLKPGERTIHPMAFSFPRRDPATLFFPTVHIHDGKVHPKAAFDHALFCQPTPEQRPRTQDWRESYTHPTGFMRVEKTKGIILADQHCYKRELRGPLPNQDTFLEMERG
jgi:hypothetical protein